MSGNVILSLLVSGVAIVLLFGASGTMTEAFFKVLTDARILFVSMLMQVIAPIGIIAALCGWRYGIWWTLLFVLMCWYDVGEIYWSNWSDQHVVPGPGDRFCWFMAAVVAWGVYTFYAFLLRGQTRKSLDAKA